MRSPELHARHGDSPHGESGQTMAEYGVVLAVITAATVGVFTALSGGVIAAVERVIGLIPT